MEEIGIRRFRIDDVDNKIKWINDSRNNMYLHYDLPLEKEKTIKWFEKYKNDESRYDAVIEYNGIPVGVIGLINIDTNKKKAEYYITLGENDYKRKGISYEASKKLIDYGFNNYDIQKIWLCVDDENVPAKKLYEKIGFKLEGVLKRDIFFKGKMIDRCMYGICRDEWSDNSEHTNY